MKTGKVERKVQTPGHKKTLSATQTPKSPQILKHDQKLLTASKVQLPQGFNFHVRNYSDQNYKSLYDALNNPPSQLNTPINKNGFPIMEYMTISPITSARGIKPSPQQSRENSIMFRNKEQLLLSMQGTPVQPRPYSKQTSTRPSSSKHMSHKKSSSTDFKAQDLTRALHAKILQGNFDSQKRLSPVTKHRKAHSSHVSPLKSTTTPLWSGANTKSSQQKNISNFSNIFAKAYHENLSKSGSRRPSSHKVELGALAESLRKLQKQKIPANQSPQLSQREEDGIGSKLSSQKATPMHKNNSTASLKIDFNSHIAKEQAKDHRRVLEANFRNMGIQQNQDQSHTPYSKKPSQAKVISEIVDIVHDNKKAGRFANNQALQSVFNKVSKYIPRPKPDMLRNSGNNFFYKQQSSQADIDFQDVALSRKSSTHVLHGTKSDADNHYLPSFGKIANENEESVQPTAKNSDAEIVYSFSRRSSQGKLDRELNSLVGSKENSPKAQGHRKVMPFRVNDLRENPDKGTSNNKISKLVEPSVHFILDESLMKKETKIWKHPSDGGNDLDFESMKVYKNLQEGNTLLKNSSIKLINTSEDTDLKSSLTKSSKFDASQLEKALSRLNVPSSSKGSRNVQTAKVNDVEKLKANKSSPKPVHKKGSKSVSTSSAVDMMLNGVHLPVNLQKLGNHKLFTPELSKKNSLNNSTVMEGDSQTQTTDQNNYKIPVMQLTNNEEEQEAPASSYRMKPLGRGVSGHEIEKIRLAFSAKTLDNTIVQTPEPSARDMQTKIYDEESMKEKLSELIKDHFKSQSAMLSTSLDYYRLIRMIGKGAFGKVYLGIHILTGQQVAIKSIDKQYMKDEHSKKKVFQEVLILKKCNHKNVIKLLEVFENKKYLFIVQEYASEGDLLSYVKERGKLSENEAKGLILQIVHGVRYCHRHNILHRDIKLENILLDKGMVVKICDFGVSRFVKSGQIINEQCGTPAYIAPEILLDKGYEGCYADLWSLGVLVYATITGTVPFTGNDLDELHNAIIIGKFSLPNYLSEEAKDLISRFLKLNPYSRIDIEAVESHAWFDSTKKMGDPLSPTAKETLSTTNTSKGIRDLDPKKLIRPDSLLKKSQESMISFKIDPAIVKKVETLGFPKEHVIQSIETNACSHASACYFLFQKAIKRY